MADEREFFNTTSGPLRYDYSGHIVGGYEWVTTKETPEIRRYLRSGEMVEKPEKPDNSEEKSAKTVGKK
jgi:hypothetical protein